VRIIIILDYIKGEINKHDWCNKPINVGVFLKFILVEIEWENCIIYFILIFFLKKQNYGKGKT
jgi:hypothetical protein